MKSGTLERHVALNSGQVEVCQLIINALLAVYDGFLLHKSLVDV